MASEREYHVLVSRGLLPQLREWSQPLHVRVTGEVDGVLQMEFRRPSSAVEQAASAAAEAEMRALEDAAKRDWSPADTGDEPC